MKQTRDLAVLQGRDRRMHIRELLLGRCQRGGNALLVCVAFLFRWLGVAGLAVTVFMILYLIKCALGIDLFPDRHLRDFLCF